MEAVGADDQICALSGAVLEGDRARLRVHGDDSRRQVELGRAGPGDRPRCCVAETCVDVGPVREQLGSLDPRLRFEHTGILRKPLALGAGNPLAGLTIAIIGCFPSLGTTRRA